MNAPLPALAAALAVPPRLTVRQILHPHGVALIGASADEAKYGGRLLRYMKTLSHGGPLYPINARATELMGLPAYASVRDCPGPVDLAVILLPSQHVQAAVEDCVAKAVGCALVIAAGFAETGAAGREAEERLVATARAGGMRLIGPNCMGLVNTHHPLAATTGKVMAGLAGLPLGGLGLASQSGALMGTLIACGLDLGAGFSSTISVGNQADLDLNDFFEYLVDDPKTEVVCLYMEGVKDAPRFAVLLEHSARVGKPVCIVKSGRSEAGVRAAASHTASLAGAWPAFEATCRRWGAYLFETIYDMLQGALQLQRGKRMASRGVAIFSSSGGGGAMLADALEAHALQLPELGTPTQDALTTVLPATHRHLPLDFGMLDHSAPADPHVAGGSTGIALDRAMADPAVGAGVVLLTTSIDQRRIVDAVVAVTARTDKPLLVVQGSGSFGLAAQQVLKDAGLPWLTSAHDALAVASALAGPATHAAHTDSEGGSEHAIAWPADCDDGYLGEPAARRLLELAGIATTRWEFAGNTEAAVLVAQRIGGAVAIKGVSAAIVHKSDMGAVRLGVQGDDAVRAACEGIASAARAHGIAALNGFVVTEMWRADTELIVGVQHDPDFGPMVMVGAGGVLVELLNDVQLAPAPVSHAAALAMLRRLRSRKLFKGFRGRAPASLDAIADVIVRLGALAAASEGKLRELDINPLFVRGDQAVAADARAVIGKPES